MKLILTLIFLIYINSSYAQKIYALGDDEEAITHLKQSIQTAQTDSLKCILNYQLSLIYFANKDDEHFSQCLNLANTLSSNNPYLKDIGKYYNSFNCIKNNDIENYKKSLLEFNEIIKKRQDKFSIKLRVLSFQSIVAFRMAEEKDIDVIKLQTEEAIPLAQKINDNELLSNSYKWIALVLMNNKKRDKAHEYFLKSIECIEKVKSESPFTKELKAEIYISSSENLIYLEKLEEAKRILDKAALILKQYPESNLNGIYFTALGLYYDANDSSQKALFYYDEAIRISEKHNDYFVANRVRMFQYLYYSVLKDYPKALRYLAEFQKNDIYKKNSKIYLKEFYKTYSLMGDYKNAFEYAQQYSTLSDSLYEANYQKDIGELEARFNKTENEKRIAKLNAANEKNKNQKLNFIIALMISALLILGLLFLWMQSRRKRQIALQKEQLLQQEIETMQAKEKLAISAAMMTGEEQERKRVARDLHDGLGSQLAALKFELSKINTENDSQTIISGIRTKLNDTIQELRNIAQNMMPETLLHIGLPDAISDFCKKMETTQTHIAFQNIGIEKALSKSMQITIYRIVQELVTNALKHSAATQIIVQCSQNEEHFWIEVEDNGKGFDAQADYTGMGLKNLKTRIAFLKGAINIKSVQNQGTEVHIIFPLSAVTYLEAV